MVHFSWKVSDWFSKWKGGGAPFARRPFFLLDNQIIRIFRLKNRLIILRAVTYVLRGMTCSILNISLLSLIFFLLKLLSLYFLFFSH